MGDVKRVDPLKDDFHIGRAWTGHDLEDECRCPQEPCGLISQAKRDQGCPQHGMAMAKTIRQNHPARYCPDRPAPLRAAVYTQDHAIAKFNRLRSRVKDWIARWKPASTIRFWLSYLLGAGHWFHDKHDRCRGCDAMPSDIDFEMRRVAPFRAECIDQQMCRECQEETAAHERQEPPDA